MARHPLESFPNSAGEQGGKRSSCGGVTMSDKKDVMNYMPPTGPKHMMETGPGLRGGTNYGCCGTQGLKSFHSPESGMVGIGGDMRKKSGGMQGRR